MISFIDETVTRPQSGKHQPLPVFRDHLTRPRSIQAIGVAEPEYSTLRGFETFSNVHVDLRRDAPIFCTDNGACSYVVKLLARKH